jgi:hypothetical protein
MNTTSPHTSVVTHQPAEVGTQTHSVHVPSRWPERAMVQTRISSFADGMTAPSDNAERTVGSFATGMITHPERSRALTGSFADGLAAVSEPVHARIGSFADSTSAHGLGDGIAAREAEFATDSSPARDRGEDVVCDTASAVTQDTLAA